MVVGPPCRETEVEEFIMNLEKGPVAKSEMLIRRPVSEVFEAFVNPAVTSRFWFTKGSGRLEAGKEVRWEWEMYNFSVQVRIVEQNKRIVVEWAPTKSRPRSSGRSPLGLMIRRLSASPTRG